MKNTVDLELGVSKGDIFSEMYPLMNKLIFENSNKAESRNGNTVEYLNWKTEILSPRYRCVGGNGRDINIFFLLAEAMWIWLGRKDVKFLEIFNSNIAKFSDDGDVFHAPYGHRIRHFGIPSVTPAVTNYNKKGKDQLLETLLMLGGIKGDGEFTRRAVMQIWNADLDLGTETKDIPCNDLVFLQRRDEKLHMTIANRSNDLHWGLPTNVFQFSFLLECMCACLGLKMGTQTHNSKSLHIYLDNPIAEKMLKNYTSIDETQLYTGIVVPKAFDFNFGEDEVSVDPLVRMCRIDSIFSRIVNGLERLWGGDYSQSDYSKNLQWVESKSEYFAYVFQLLAIYIEYKKRGKPNDESRMRAIDNINILINPVLDLQALALNFFISRIKDEEKRRSVFKGVFNGLGKL